MNIGTNVIVTIPATKKSVKKTITGTIIRNYCTDYTMAANNGKTVTIAYIENGSQEYAVVKKSWCKRQVITKNDVLAWVNTTMGVNNKSNLDVMRELLIDYQWKVNLYDLNTNELREYSIGLLTDGVKGYNNMDEDELIHKIMNEIVEYANSIGLNSFEDVVARIYR